MTKERRLGRGLEALLGQIPARSGPAAPGAAGGSSASAAPVGDAYGGATEDPYAPGAAGGLPGATGGSSASAVPDAAVAVPPAEHPAAANTACTRVNIDQIDSNPAQPRQDFDPQQMQSLAESIAAHGLLQPVVVRPANGRYQLIAGERRLRAAVQAGWTDVPVNIVDADDREVAELAIIENLHRKDLNPLEKAASFHRYLEQYGGTQDELAGRLNLDRSTIANLIRLLELPETVQEAIRRGKITQGHARALLPLGEEREQIAFCERVQREGLSVRQTEALVQETIDAADAEPLSVIDRDGKQTRPARGRSEHVAALEQELRAALGVKVKLTHNARGRGKMVIHFRNHEEFDRLRRHICDPGSSAAQSRAG